MECGWFKICISEVETEGSRKKELIDRLLPFTKNENQLLEKRLNEVRKSYIFETSMDSSQLPPPASVWNADQTRYPKLDSTTISDYTRFKRQGRKGQYHKAQRIFYSRKIKTVKTLKDDEVTFVKAMVIKSFGQEITRPAVLMFRIIIQ